jgi:hypothetical protein
MNHSLPPTTHTLEMAQVSELNARLADRLGSPPITAGTIGMGGAALHFPAEGRLPEAAVLVQLSWEGSPEFPDIYGHFGGSHAATRCQSLLHTAALEELCSQLGVRQHWGLGPDRRIV